MNYTLSRLTLDHASAKPLPLIPPRVDSYPISPVSIDGSRTLKQYSSDESRKRPAKSAFDTLLENSPQQNTKQSRSNSSVTMVNDFDDLMMKAETRRIIVSPSIVQPLNTMSLDRNASKQKKNSIQVWGGFSSMARKLTTLGRKKKPLNTIQEVTIERPMKSERRPVSAIKTDFRSSSRSKLGSGSTTPTKSSFAQTDDESNEMHSPPLSPLAELEYQKLKLENTRLLLEVQQLTFSIVSSKLQ